MRESTRLGPCAPRLPPALICSSPGTLQTPLARFETVGSSSPPHSVPQAAFRRGKRCRWRRSAVPETWAETTLVPSRQVHMLPRVQDSLQPTARSCHLRPCNSWLRSSCSGHGLRGRWVLPSLECSLNPACAGMAADLVAWRTDSIGFAGAGRDLVAALVLCSPTIGNVRPDPSA